MVKFAGEKFPKMVKFAGEKFPKGFKNSPKWWNCAKSGNKHFGFIATYYDWILFWFGTGVDEQQNLIIIALGSHRKVT